MPFISQAPSPAHGAARESQRTMRRPHRQLLRYRIFQWFARQIAFEFFNHAASHPPAFGPHRPGNVGRDHHILQGIKRRVLFRRFFDCYVQDRVKVRPAGENRDHLVLLYQFAAHGIDESSGFHGCEMSTCDHPAGLGKRGCVQRDRVAAAEQIVERYLLDAERLCFTFREERVVRQHVEFEGAQQFQKLRTMAPREMRPTVAP